METLSKDIVEKITTELSIRDFLNFCKDNPQCDKLWGRRLQRDFGYIENTNLYGYESFSDKKKYLAIIGEISNTCKYIVDGMFKKMRKQAKFFEPYRNQMIQFFFDNILQIMREISKLSKDDLEGKRNMIFETDLGGKMIDEGYIPDYSDFKNYHLLVEYWVDDIQNQIIFLLENLYILPLDD